MYGGALEEWYRCQRDRRGTCRLIHVRIHPFEEGTVVCVCEYICCVTVLHFPTGFILASDMVMVSCNLITCRLR